MLSTQQLIAEADRCVACGLCLPHCPTYRKTGSEADSPRGRIQLMSAVAKEILPANARFKEHIDLCLSCRSCESACPNGVAYGTLIDATRVKIAKPSTLNKMMQHVVNHPKCLVAVSNTLRVAQNLGVLSVASKLIPALKKPINLLPDLSQIQAQSWAAVYASNQAHIKGDVSLFLGCVTNAFDTNTLHAAIFTLNALGYHVHIPPTQTCCGGIARQQGDAETANQLIAQNEQAFTPLNKMPLLTVASGCGAGLQDYLAKNTHLAVQDISAFLVACDWSKTSLEVLPQDIYVQDPCTLRNVQKSANAVYQLLEKIPAAKIKKLAGNGQCCGGAGTYMLSQANMADNLREDKLNAIAADEVTWLATSNIGCALHITAGLKQARQSVKVQHPVAIIAQQLGFVNPLN